MNEFQTNFQLVIFLGPDIRRLFWIRVQIITLAQSFLVFMSNHKKYVLVFREINQFVTFWQQLRMQWTEHSQIAQHNSVTEPKPQHLNQIELVEIQYRCCPEPWPESWLPYKYIYLSIHNKSASSYNHSKFWFLNTLFYHNPVWSPSWWIILDILLDKE